MRRKHYKLQLFNPVIVAWMDVQRRFSTGQAAIDAAPAAKKNGGWRIMEVTESGERRVWNGVILSPAGIRHLPIGRKWMGRG